MLSFGNTGELKTGLSCHHSFNNDKRYYVTSSIEKDVDRLIEDLDKAFAKYRGTYHIGSKSKTSEARKESNVPPSSFSAPPPPAPDNYCTVP